jgi:hypothetical protein
VLQQLAAWRTATTNACALCFIAALLRAQSCVHNTACTILHVVSM